MSKYSELAEEIAEEVAVMSRRKFYEGRTVKLKKDIAALIDEKLSGVRLSVEQAYIETLSTIHEEAWKSVKIEE